MPRRRRRIELPLTVFDRGGVERPALIASVLYAHGDMYGSVTVTQGSPYISNAVTHPRYMFEQLTSQKSPKSAHNLAFLGICVHE
jgi:hypothetical protein